jgi:Cu/Ag efflux protein CusF
MSGSVKRAMSLFLIVLVLLAFVGVALAAEMTGVVTAVDVEKSTITMKSEKMAVSFDCETGSLLKGIKAGDTVTVQYTEEGGKKLATSVTRMAPMK